MWGWLARRAHGYPMPETIVVIPCYNEADRLDVDGLLQFAQTSSDLGFLLVDDGSTDATRELLERLHRTRPDLFGVHGLPRNRGKAEAVRQGVLRAFSASPDFVAFWDADLSTPLAAIAQFRAVLRARPECQLVMGSRVALLGRRVQRRWSRHLMGRVFATVASAALGLRIYDTQCGAKMFRASPRLEAVFHQTFLSRWIFDVELLARLTCSGLFEGMPLGQGVVYELPLDEWRDVSGSKLKSTDFAKAVWELAAIYGRYMHPYRRRQRTSPPSAYTASGQARTDAETVADVGHRSPDHRKAA